MASQLCWRCLVRTRGFRSRILLADTPIVPSVRPFSTSTARPAGARGSKARRLANANRAQVKSKVKKQAFAQRSPSEQVNVPAQRGGSPVERSKRIVLSNTNALEVKELEDLNTENAVNDESKGKVLGIPGPIVDQLRVAEAFKRTQAWDMFRRPAMLMRQETLELAKLMSDTKINKSKTRRVLVGDRLTGKTTMLLQAMTLAFLKGWVVINLPKAHDLVYATTEYSPVTDTLPTTYTQPAYTASLLSAIARANPILFTLPLSGSHTLLPTSSPADPTEYVSALPTLPPNTTLSSLCTLGSTEAEAAWPIFTLLMKELLLPPGRPPVLLCLDHLHQAMTMSRYRDAEYGLIHAYQLELVKWFMDALGGRTEMANGGIVMAATSAAGDTPRVPALDWCLQRLEAGEEVGEGDPYGKFDGRVMGIFEDGGVEVKRLGALSKEEARGLLDYWALSGMFPQTIDQERVDREVVMSSGGVIGELERGCLRAGPALKELSAARG